MHDSSLMLASPEASDQLVLLFHGVGSSAQDLAPVGQALAQARPRATVVSVEAPQHRSWAEARSGFSVVGVTEENRRSALPRPCLCSFGRFSIGRA